MDNIILENMYFEHNISSLTDKYIIECYEESYVCESVLDSIKTFFSNLKEKVKNIFNDISTTIKGTFKEKQDKLNKTALDIKKNPKLSRQKVQITDPNKVEAEIDKQKKEYLNNKNKEKGKFKVNKNEVLTKAKATVTLDVATTSLKKKFNEMPDKVKRTEQEVIKSVDMCEKEANDSLVAEFVWNRNNDKSAQDKAAEIVQVESEALIAEYEALSEEYIELQRALLDAFYIDFRISRGDREGLNDDDTLEKYANIELDLDSKIVGAYYDIGQRQQQLDKMRRKGKINDDEWNRVTNINNKRQNVVPAMIADYNLKVDELGKRFPLNNN
jgi:hypothetical protein